MHEIRFTALFTELPAVMKWVRKHTQEAGLSLKDQQKLEVALEEALVNVLSYAYSQQTGEISLTAELVPTEKLQFTIKDRGPPFNPLLHHISPIDPNESLEEKRVGGLGIFFIKSLMDQVIYERKEPYNILILIKNLYI